MNGQGGELNHLAEEEPRGGPARYEPDLTSHIPALDAVRGIAILLVTAFRFNSEVSDASPMEHALSGLLRHGQHGVDLFFVLSGFLITGILFDAKDDRHYFRTQDWGKLLGDVPSATAILDRFLHHSEVIQITGKSYRLATREKAPKDTKAPTGSAADEKPSR